jgi:hypothetical protein
MTGIDRRWKKLPRSTWQCARRSGAHLQLVLARNGTSSSRRLAITLSQLWPFYLMRHGLPLPLVQCISNGLKNIQLYARSYLRKQRNGQQRIASHGYDDDSAVSGIGLTPVDDLDPASDGDNTSETSASSASSDVDGRAVYASSMQHPHDQDQYSGAHFMSSNFQGDHIHAVSDELAHNSAKAAMNLATDHMQICSSDNIRGRDLASAGMESDNRAPYLRHTSVMFQRSRSQTTTMPPQIPSSLDLRPTSPAPSSPRSGHNQFSQFSPHSSISSTVSPFPGSATRQGPVHGVERESDEQPGRARSESASSIPSRTAEAMATPCPSATELLPETNRNSVPASLTTFKDPSPSGHNILDFDAVHRISPQDLAEDCSTDSNDDDDCSKDEKKDRILAFCLRTLFGLDQVSLTVIDRRLCSRLVENLVEGLEWTVFQHNVSSESAATEPSDGDVMEGDAAHDHSGQPTSSGGRSERHYGKRKKLDDANDDRNGESSGSNPGPGNPADGATPKRPKAAGLKISCPFRKRNWKRFNVRDHRKCALTYYSSFSDLRFVR